MTDASDTTDVQTGTQPDTADFDVEVVDGKTLAPVEALEQWDDNPRDVTESDIERLKSQIQSLSQYKPLIVTTEGVVLGGNMRLRALSELGEELVWVSIVEADSHDERLEYALSDNDRVGFYEEDAMVELVSDTSIDLTQFKPDFYEPKDMSQYLAHAMDPDDLLGDGDDEADDTDGDGEGDGGDATERSMERLGQDSTTTMVQLYMTEGQKDRFLNEFVERLKEEWGHDNTTDVVLDAVERMYQRVESPDVETKTADELVEQE